MSLSTRLRTTPSLAPAPVVVTLGPLEYAHIALGGFLRQTQNLLLGRVDAHGYAGDGFSAQVIGALGEAALAKHHNVYWSVGRLRAPDVGAWQVRTATRPSDSLILHDSDDDDAAYVFAIVAPQRLTVRLVGWLWGREGKRREWWRDPTGAGRGAYFVAQSNLRAMEGLR